MELNESEIKITVKLDENKIPEEILWDAPGAGINQEQSKALMLSVWDPKKMDTLRMDIWTKDMPVDDMKKFFHQTLLSMSDSFQRATNDEKMANTMKDFCHYFAEKLELLEG